MTRTNCSRCASSFLAGVTNTNESCPDAVIRAARRAASPRHDRTMTDGGHPGQPEAPKHAMDPPLGGDREGEPLIRPRHLEPILQRPVVRGHADSSNTDRLPLPVRPDRIAEKDTPIPGMASQLEHFRRAGAVRKCEQRNGLVEKILECTPRIDQLG